MPLSLCREVSKYAALSILGVIRAETDRSVFVCFINSAFTPGVSALIFIRGRQVTHHSLRCLREWPMAVWDAQRSPERHTAKNKLHLIATCAKPGTAHSLCD